MKLKKSLLIVPAMGTLLLAAAGSVGGTVAWFSANTEYNMTAGQFAVGALDGNLSVALTNIHGTTCNDTSKTVTVTTGDLLADASFNLTSGVLYTDSGNNNGTATGFTALNTLAADGTITDANWYAKQNFSGELDMHWAIAWKMSFTYAMPSTGIQQNLYFDNKTSGATKTEGTEGAALFTYKGFRLAFFPLTSTDATPVARVWAPLTSETDVTKLKYVSGTTSSSTTAYTTGNMMLKLGTDDTLAPAKTAASSNSTGANYLGCFEAGHANTNVTMNMACVAWYEGLDSNVVSSASKDIVTQLAMYFYVLPNS